MSNVESVNIELAHGQNALRTYQASIQKDTHDIDSTLMRIDQCLNSVERCLDLRELADPQKTV
jgi:hypothetical protein